MNLDLAASKKWFAENREPILSDYFDFLRFKTIATDPAYHDECQKCAEWLVSYLQGIGLEATLWETSGQPVVFASHLEAGEARPTLLVYHHYDVQPIDPLELWKSDPFEPTIRDNKVYARGAQDNKGQCFYSIAAIKALLQSAKEIGFNLKVFIEGEEESGSSGTKDVFASRQQELKSDYLLVVDSGIPAKGVPAITLGMRGIITAEVKARGSNEDLHSGTFGGIVYSPLRALTEALSSLWDPSGKITIPGFYDDVKDYSKEELELIDTEVDQNRLQKEAGLRAFAPEPGYTIGQSGSIRPTVEINGLSGGYTGEGFKTVIPAVASAKISCRLVSEQNPEKVAASLKEYLLGKFPKGMEVEVEIDQGAAPFRCNQNSPIAKVAATAYEEVMGKPCKSIMGGGSVPIVSELAKATGAESLAIGYGLDSDLIHAPNEHFGLDRFELGFLTMGRIFSRLYEERK
ncbi:MAG: Succinyl-diaminopimelate desuccinylase [Chlamydiae bacterium]|nr:Succinyl-diaminopimelate desuccinylase [Chlamydiota bacterium]